MASRTRTSIFDRYEHHRHEALRVHGQTRPAEDERRTPHPPAAGNHRSPVTRPGYHRGRRPGNAGKTYPAEVLTTSEMMRLLAATGGGYAGCRDKALYTLMWRTGLRIAETLALMPKDIDLERGQLTVLHGKNDKRRMVGFDPRTGDALAVWMRRRAELGVGRDQPVFCVISRPTVGKALYSSCVREQLRDCARRAGIEKRVHPHGLRHTCASELAMENLPLPVISQMLGHSNSATTARYIDHVNPHMSIEASRARVWGDEESERE